MCAEITSQFSASGPGSFSSSRSVTHRCSLDAMAVQSTFNWVSGLSRLIDFTCRTLKPSACACGTSNPSRSAELAIASAYNVASVVRTAQGRYRVHFAINLPDTNYCWTALARSSTNSGTQRLAIVRSSSDLKTEQFVDIACATAQASFDDSTEINLVVYR